MAPRGRGPATGDGSRHTRIDLAGGCSVTVDGRRLTPTELGSRRGRLLIELLAASRGRALSCDEIVAVLWPDAPPHHPEAAVATLVSRLRSVLGSGAVLGGRGSYRQGTSPDVDVDLDEAATLVDEAERRLAAEPAVAATAAQRALSLLSRPALEDHPYDSWADGAREEQTTLVRRARSVATRASLQVGDHETAAGTALAQVADDPLDETAHRHLMRAYQLAGSAGRALRVYAELRDRLDADLGTEPSPQTQQLYLAILRDQDAPEPDVRTAAAARAAGLIGRGRELDLLLEAWDRTAGGHDGASLTLLMGEAGIGKTRLAEELVATARRTGATVLEARCYEAERSLFLQPVVDALTQRLVAMPPAAVARLCAADAPALASVLPVVGSILAVDADHSGNESLRQQRAFDAVRRLLTRLADDAPVLLWLDDVHNAGRTTLELLHYLARHRGGARFLVVTAARWEARDGLRDVLGDAVAEVELGPLDRQGVLELATAAGRADMTDAILERTSGHTLYVVEVLAALQQGSTDVPESLRSAVLERVRRSGSDVEVLLRAAAVLGATVEPSLVARLTGRDEQPTLASCEQALTARLLVVAGRHYEFAHDLVREVLYASTPEPTRVAQHLRAADLLGNRPEAVAAHAAAAGDWSRAARAGLLAAENALRGLAARDAIALASHVIGWATSATQPELQARALLVRARAREMGAGYDDALDDLQQSLAIARDVGDQRLEMLVLRQLGGDVSTALRLHVRHYREHLDAALHLAESLGDHVVEADLLDRMTVLNVNRLRFDDAIACADRARAAADASRDVQAHVLALDGMKSVYAYLGETTELARTTAELEPLLRQRQDLWLLQWTVFESAFVPLAAGRHDRARALMEEALAVNRRSGYLSYQSWFLVHLAWQARLAGDVTRALALGEQSVRAADELTHPWWHAATFAMHAVTLLRTGDAPGATALLERALPVADEAGTEAHRLRCLSALAEATGSLTLLQEADGILTGIQCPAGSAWLLGADTYLCVARSWLARGEPDRARHVLAPLLRAARRCGWVPLLEQAAPVVVRLGSATPLQR
jgi:DNA-binding SARP family transcriptional activator/tetratricopeptide (TPR) repeat protein